MPGTRLSLLGAWQADGEGLYQITERGVYLNPKDGRAKRLIPAGESTLDPLPFVVPELVAPNGKYLGWFDMHYNRTGIERMDLGVMPLRERGRKVHLKNLVLAAAGWSRNGEVLAALQNARGGLRLALFDTTEGKLKTYRTKLQLIDDQFPTRAFVSHSGRYVVLNGPITDHAFLSTVVFDRQEETLTVLDAFGDHIVGGWTTDDRIVLGDMIMVMTIRPDGGDQRIIYPPGTDAHAFRVSPAPSQLRERVAPLLNAPWQQRWAAVR